MSLTQRFSQNPLRCFAGAVMIFLLSGFFLVACGSSTTTGGQSTSTPSAQTVNCGQVNSSGLGLAPSAKAAAQKAENCFYQAFQQCQSATLKFTSFGVDAGTIHNFAVKNVNGSCAITDGVQHYIAPNPPSAAITYTCATMQMQTDGLHIQACGDAGSIVIPS
jgi:hypothetical protein